MFIEKQCMKFLRLPFILVIALIVVFSCKKEVEQPQEIPVQEIITEELPIIPHTKEEVLLDITDYNDTVFVKLNAFSKDFIFDMKYATEDNFLKTKVYDCPECFLRARTVKALLEANKDFMLLGYRIKLFDCYRPLDIQKKMWAILPHTNYVASPMRGSIHNRGGAVDLTLTDEAGNEIDMGTPFDFFGPEGHHDYKNLSKEILAHRKLLKETMLKHNFRSINSEWWHYNLIGATHNPVSNFKWECE